MGFLWHQEFSDFQGYLGSQVQARLKIQIEAFCQGTPSRRLCQQDSGVGSPDPTPASLLRASAPPRSRPPTQRLPPLQHNAPSHSRRKRKDRKGKSRQKTMGGCLQLGLGCARELLLERRRCPKTGRQLHSSVNTLSAIKLYASNR